MSEKECAGVEKLKGAPTLLVKVCGACGEEVELFSNETEVKCPKCGGIVKNDDIPAPTFVTGRGT